MKTSKVFTAVMLLGVLTAATFSYGQPPLINFQGKLTADASIAILKFAIYDAAEGGEPLWTETHQGVGDTTGVLSVLLGSINPLPSSVFDGQDLWLGITGGGDSEMTPRVPIASVGYAIHSLTADTAEYAKIIAGSCWECPPEGGPVYTLRGSVGIGTDDPEATLHVNGPNVYLGPDRDNRLGWGFSDSTGYVTSKSGGSFDRLYIRGDPVVFDKGNVHIDGDLTVTGEIDPVSVTFIPQTTEPPVAEGKVYYNDGDDELYVCDGANNWRPLIGGDGGPDGDWTIVGDDMYSAVSGNVGIGTTSPDAKAHVVSGIPGGVAVLGDGYTGVSGQGGAIGVAGSGAQWAGYFNGNGYFSGNVGIGTEDLAYKLDVDGDLYVGSHLMGGSGVVIDGRGTTMKAVGGAAQVDLHLQPASQGGNILLAEDGGNVGIGIDNPAYRLHVIETEIGMTAVRGEANVGGGVGVFGLASGGSFGVHGSCNTGTGVYGISANPDGKGVHGFNNAATGNAIGVYGVSNNGFGGYFEGKGYFSDNLGVGTTSPGHNLDVQGDAHVAERFYDSSGNPGTNGQVLSSTGNGTDWINLSSPADNDWEVSSGNVFTGHGTGGYPSGNVGIGTTAPDAKLHVVDDGCAMTTGFHLECKGDGKDLFLAVTGGKAHIWANPVGAGGVPIILGNNDAIVIPGTQDRVGIGTMTPYNKLDVEGTLGMRDSDIYFRGTSSQDTYHGVGWYGGGGKSFAGVTVDGPVLYGLQGGMLGSKSGGEKFALRWDGSGNVGIGTDPEYLCHVEGNQPGSMSPLEFKPVAYLKNTSDDNSVGIRGEGYTRGVEGIARSDGGYGVYGEALGSGLGAGVFGTNSSASGKAIWAKQWGDGFALYATGGKNFFSGNVGIKTTSPGVELEVAGDARAQMFQDRDNTAYYVDPASNSNMSNLTVDSTLTLGGVGRTTWPEAGIGGSGTTNYIPKFTGSTSIGNSHIFESGSNNIGIGTTTPEAQFHVVGEIKVENGRLRVQNGGLNVIGGTISLSQGLGFGDYSGYKKIQSYDNEPLSINPDAHNVGIGTTNPGYKLDVAGQAHATSFPTSSDARLKTNVTQLTNVLEKLEKIRGVSFEWNELYESLGRSTGHGEIGVIAQEVEAVFPELVTTWGDESYMAVDYGRMTGVLIEAVKELKERNDALKQRIEVLEGKLVEKGE